MKKIYTILLVLIARLAFTQPYVEWVKVFPVADVDEWATSLATTPDSGYLMMTSSLQLIRLNRNSDTLWTRPVNGLSEAQRIRSTDDGGSIIVGTSGYAYLTVVKLDSLGNSVWRFVDPDTNVTYGQDIAILGDSGYVAIGSFAIRRSIVKNPYAVSLTCEGNGRWYQSWGAAGRDGCANAAIAASNGNIIVAGTQAGEARLFELDNDAGGIVWNFFPWTGIPSAAMAVCTMPAGGYTAAGYRQRGASARNEFLVWRFSEGGSNRWLRTFATPQGEEARSVLSASRDRVLVSGTQDVYYFGAGRRDIWLMGLDSLGLMEWDTVLGSPGWDYHGEMVSTADGAFAIAGGSSRGAGEHAAITLWKFCPEGSDAADVSHIAERNQISAFRLHHQSGEIRTLIFTNIVPGSIGSVTGNASVNWSVLPNGDGNDGDSIIFQTLSPLTTGQLDTFWIQYPSQQCSIRWKAGCRAHDLELTDLGRVDSLRFEGTWYSSSVRFRLTTFHERNVLSFELLAQLHTSPGYTHITEVQAINDSGAHVYEMVHSPTMGADRYLIVMHDAFGCTHAYYNKSLGLMDLDVPRPQHEMAEFYQLSAYPNPFNPTTTLSFALPVTGQTRIAVYDLLGREVQLLEDRVISAGEHRLTFDGASLPSGLYFARMQSSGFVATQKLLLLK